MKHIVILRFATISESAIAAPLIRAYALANPDTKFTMVALPLLSPLYEGIDNLYFLPARSTEEQIEKPSLSRIYLATKHLLSSHPTCIVDFSNSRLSRAVCSLFKFHGVGVFTPAVPNKLSKMNDSLISCYERTLALSGLNYLDFSKPHDGQIRARYNFHRIGIAPFAKYDGKSWPIEKMEKVVEMLSSDPNAKIYLFGDKNNEAQILQGWEFKYPNCESTAGKYILKEEMDLIRSLDLMVTMDSANMHFASFVQTPVISIWGATDPSLGYYGFGQDPDNAIKVDMDCRPCSLFGQHKCPKGDYACLNRITPEMVLEKIENFYK